ncbi:MAG: hypothetical protein WKF87_06420 [Chryseolinea sp.]
MEFYSFNSRIPRVLFALSLIGFSIQHFLFGEFITGRAPAYPTNFAGQSFFSFATGGLFFLCAIALVLEKNAWRLLAVCGVVILFWAAGRNILVLVANPEYGGLLTNTFKGLTLGFGAFIIAASFREKGTSSFSNKLVGFMSTSGNYIVGLFLLVAGVQHFIFVDFVNFLVPAWLPFIPFWTYFSGVALIAAGLGLITGIKRQLAALLAGYMVLGWVLLLHLPRVVEYQNQNEWTSVLEALAVGSILLIISDQHSHITDKLPQT